jgi:hypothetical protein
MCKGALLALVLGIVGCKSTSSGVRSEGSMGPDGKVERKDKAWCLGNCMERSGNNECAKFNAEVAKSCDQYRVQKEDASETKETE